MDPVYLDYHTASPPSRSSLEAFCRAAQDYWVPSEVPHFLGQQQTFIWKKSLENIFASLGLDETAEVFVNQGSAESFYHVCLSTYLALSKETGKSLFITTQGEDRAVSETLHRMEQFGCSVKKLPFNAAGQLSPDVLAAAITSRTALVSLSWASGLTGVIQPIADLVRVCQEKEVFVHLEGSYMLGKNFFRISDLGVQFLTLEGTVIQAPLGTGLTIVQNRGFLPSFIPGAIGGPIGPLAALAEAIMETQEHTEHMCLETGRLRDRLEEGVIEGFPEALVLCKNVDRLPNCSAIAFPGVYAESLLYLLNTKGVYATRGGGRLPLLESLLLQQGMPPSIAQSAISFALGWNTTEDEIERAIEIIVDCASQLAVCSKYGGL